MPRKTISINVERKLCAESMGRCMNPDCQAELFRKNGDVIEKAHIVPYCKRVRQLIVRGILEEHSTSPQDPTKYYTLK